ADAGRPGTRRALRRRALRGRRHRASPGRLGHRGRPVHLPRRVGGVGGWRPPRGRPGVSDLAVVPRDRPAPRPAPRGDGLPPGRDAVPRPRPSGSDMVTPYEVAAAVTDPELPAVTIADLGVLREVRTLPDGVVEVDLTPTYSGCPALETIRSDVEIALRRAGFADVRVRTVLAPAWTTDMITEAGRRKLAEAGIGPPGRRGAGPVFVELGVTCP